MDISMDGLRLNLLRTYNKVASLLNDSIDEETVVVDKQKLKEYMDELQQNVGILLCVYDDKQEDFNLLFGKYATIEFDPE